MGYLKVKTFQIIYTNQSAQEGASTCPTYFYQICKSLMENDRDLITLTSTGIRFEPGF